MVPNASELARRRHTLVTVFRLLALIPSGLTLVVISAGIWVGFENTRFGFFDWRDYIGFGIFTTLGLSAAAFAWWGLPLLAGLFVPRVRDLRCPFCNYKLEGLTEPRCPECGQPLTPEFMGQPPQHSAEPADPPALAVERLRAIMHPTVRVIGCLGAGLFGGLSLVLAPVAFVTYNNQNYPGEWIFPAAWLFGLALPVATFSFVWLLMPRLITRWLVPAPRLKNRSANSQEHAAGSSLPPKTPEGERP